MTQIKNESHIFDGSINLFFSLFRIFHEGIKTKFYKSFDNWILLLSITLSVSMFFQKRQFAIIFNYLSLDLLTPFFDSIINRLSTFSLTFWSFILVGACHVIFFGIKPYKKFRMYQKGLDHLNLKSGLDHQPKLLQVNSIDENRTRLLVKSTGLGEERYKTKLDDLRASVGQKIESVRFFNSDNTCVEIFLAKNLLESKVLFADVLDKLKRPYSFIVGKSQNGVITESLEDVPHYMIAGATGGGKSVAFKSMLMGLLETSERLQMYLFDFKRVEMSDFSVLPNVSVITQEIQAQLLLAQLEREMERRYRFLEDKGYKSIDPARDKMDRIVVGIDECTDLTGKVPKSHSSYTTIERARNSLDHLARKSRACGIHLIFATQKIDSDSLDTRVQENIEGRLALRMNTMENSVRVLQNSMAYHLPSIPGRAIWKKGASYAEVQSPFIQDDELKDRIKNLVKCKKFENVKMMEILDDSEDLDANKSNLIKLGKLNK